MQSPDPNPLTQKVLQAPCSLGIMLAEPSERKQFEFSFVNVKLP